MAEFIEINNIRLAFGLIWKQVENVKKEKSEGAAFVRKHKAIYKLRWSNGQAIRYAVAPKTKSDVEIRKKTDVFAGAVLFASRVPDETNAVLVIPLDKKNTKYSLVAVINGAPYLDVVISPSKVRDRLLALKDEGHSDFAMYGIHPDFPEAQYWGHETFLDGARKNDALMIKVIHRNALFVKAGIFGVAVAIAGGMQLQTYLEEKRQEEEAARAAVDPAVEYRQKLAQSLRTAGLPGAAAYEAFWVVRGKNELMVEGWSIVKVTCNRVACIEELSRLSGTNETLIASLPKDASYSFGPDKSTGDTVFVSYKNSIKPIAIEQSKLPNKEEFWRSITSSAQWFTFHKDFIGDLGVAYSPSVAKTFAMPSGISEAAIQKGMLVYKGSYTATGALGLLKDTLLRSSPNMAIDEVTMIMSDDMDAARFTVKGSYYVKN